MSEIKRVLFMGSKQLGLRVLKEIHQLSPDTLAGILTIDDSGDSRSVLPGIQAFAADNALALQVASDRQHSEQIMRAMQPDLCLVVGWYWLISPDTLDSVPAGFIGIHNSLLPEYRGGSPLVWAMINGDAEVGFSLFSLNAGMDTGDIWAQDKVSVDEKDSIGDVLDKLETKTIDVLRQSYLDILSGQANPSVQDDSAATWCAQRLPEDGNIDWRQPARAVHNFIRAQSDPYPGAFTWLGGHMLKIWRARILDQSYLGTPGQVARIDTEGVYVICGDRRALVLEEVELEAERGSAREIIRSTNTRFHDNPGSG